MKTRVDLIEQKDPTESERRERRTDQTEPCLGSGRFILQIEGDRFTFSAMYETKVTTKFPEAPGFLFDHHEIVNSRIREAKQVHRNARIRDRRSIFWSVKES